MNTFYISTAWIVLFSIVAILAILIGVGLVLKYIHLLQLQGYHIAETYQDQKIKLYKYSSHYLVPFIFDGVLCLAFCILSLRTSVWQWIALGSIVVTMIVVSNWLYGVLTTKYKLPLKLTKRVKRLLVIYVVISIIYFVGALLLARAVLSRLFLLVLPVYFVLIPFLFCLSLFVHYGIEKCIFLHYYKMSQKKCASMEHLQVIGVTGSYGKTSTKYILAQLLNKKYHVLATDKSYNTPMGISKVVLEKLNSSHEIFIAEMGADHKDDIKVLGAQVKPTIGILTSIGNAHLKTFGSIYEIMRTKYQLIEALPSYGYAVFNGDCDYELNLIHKTTIKKGVVISRNRLHLIDTKSCDNIAIIEKMSCGKGGAEIVITTKNNTYAFKTSLLGRHQATNIGSAILVAEYLQVEYEDILQSLNTLQNVEHRLSASEVGESIILDDSFNCNIEGARNALEVLSLYDDYEKVVITPGIVEGGVSSASLNYTLGGMIAKVADHLVIVNTINKIDITKGVIDANSNTKLHYVSTFEEARKTYLVQKKAVYLLLNDLPDQYE